MQKDILSDDAKKLIVYLLDNDDFKEAPKLLNLTPQKFKELVIKRDELVEKFDSSCISQSQKLLISTYLHLYAALHTKDLKTYSWLIDLRKVLNITDEYVFSIFNALNLINPKALLNGRKPLECIIKPPPEICMWAANVVYRFLQEGIYIKKRKITNLDPKEYEHPFDKKALDITLIDLKGITTLTDYFIICTSESDPQTRAIFNHIKDQLIKKDVRPWKTEGHEYLHWVIMDYINFVIHIFNKEARSYYDFERLWGDANIIKVKN